MARHDWIPIASSLNNKETTVETGEVIDSAGSNGLDIVARISPYIELRDMKGHTPLIVSLHGKHLDVAKYLISEGANVHAVDLYGCGAIFYASNGGKGSNKEFFESFLSQGVDINQRSIKGDTVIDSSRRKEKFRGSHRTRTKFFPLLFAAEAGNVTLVKELMKRMTMEEITTESETKGTPLYIATFRGRMEVVKAMLEADVDIDIPSRGETPLEAATKEGHWNVVEGIKRYLDLKETKEIEKEDKGCWSLKLKKEELAMRPKMEELDDEVDMAEDASTNVAPVLL